MDFLLKQRLIGAVVLVALGVIFIPMLLEDNVRPEVPVMKAIPEPEVLPKYKRGNKLTSTNAKLSLPSVGVITKEKAIEGSKSVKKKAVAIAKKPLPPIKAAQKKPAPKKQSAKPKVIKPAVVAKTRKVPGPLKSWIVQAGSFSSQSNAFTLRDKLRKSGLATQVDRVVLDSGVTFRVRVGPYAQMPDAEKVMARIGKKFRLKPKILSYP